MKKSYTILVLIVALALCVGGAFIAIKFVSHLDVTKLLEKKMETAEGQDDTLAGLTTDEELGKIKEQEVDEINIGPERIIEGDEDVNAPTQMCNAIVTNMELVNDLLTLQALGDLKFMLSEWINKNGYDSDELVLFSIDQSSIIYDKSYPYFIIEQIDDPSKRISVVYDFETYSYKFAFVNR